MKKLILTAMFVAIISVSSIFSIPFLGFPITLQSFSIFLALLILGGKLGTVAVALYIFIGAVGLPVFAGGGSGIGRLFDITGGFIFGFFFAALVYWLIVSILKRRTAGKIFALLISNLVLYVVGISWYVYAFDAAISVSLLLVFRPYLAFDAFKIAFAFYLASRVEKIFKSLD